MSKRCARCRRYLPLEQFNTRRHGDGYASYCKACYYSYHKQWTTDNRERTRHLYRRAQLRKYGLTTYDYRLLLEQQQGRCAICNRTQDVLAVDHDHTDGRVRGLLCDACNTALGGMADDPTRLRRAADYLERTVDLRAVRPLF